MRAIVAESGERLTWQEVPTSLLPPARSSSRSLPPGSTAPTCCKPRATTRRRRAPATIIGLEVSGTIAAVGDGVARLVRRATGLRFAGRRWLRRIRRRPRRAGACRCPTVSTCTHAAGLPEVACTVWSNLVMTARPARGPAAADPRRRQRHRHPRHPGGPRTGLPGRRHRGLAEQARAVRRARRRDHHQLPRRGLRRAGRARAGGAGADVILDIMGAAYLDRNIDALATDGRLVDHRHAGRRQGRTQHRQAARPSAPASSRRRCGPARSSGPGGKSDDRRRGGGQRLADGRRRPGAADHRRRVRRSSRPRAAHELLDSGEVSGKVLLRVAD